MRVLYINSGYRIYELNTYEKVFTAMGDALKGIRSLHELAMIHGDVAPHNITFFEGIRTPLPDVDENTPRGQLADDSEERKRKLTDGESVGEDSIGYGAIIDFDGMSDSMRESGARSVY